MVKAVLIVLSVILSATVKVNSLQCYVCYDCLEVKDEYLTSCESLATTTTTTAVPTTTTSTATTTSTTTTVAPETNTTTSTTTTPAPDTTTTTSTTSTPAPDTTTTTSTTTTPAPDTTTTTSTTTTPAPDTTTTTSTTTTPAPDTTTTTPAPETNTAPTDSTGTANSAFAAETSLRRVKRADVTYECFQGKVHVNNTDVIVRGCAVGRTNQTCEQFGLSGCSFCDTDKCNGAWTIQSSLVVLVVAFFLSIVIKE